MKWLRNNGKGKGKGEHAVRSITNNVNILKHPIKKHIQCKELFERALVGRRIWHDI